MSCAPAGVQREVRVEHQHLKEGQLPFAAEARATLRADGTGLVETSLIDMGQGAWTALAQIAADALGIDIDKLELRGGASDLPDGGIAGGSGAPPPNER